MIQLILVLAIFFPTKWVCWKITEVWGLPTFLDYMPWVCRKCLSFWSLTALYLVCGLICHLWLTMAVGLILTALDTVAVIVDQRRKTMKVDVDIYDENNNLIGKI